MSTIPFGKADILECIGETPLLYLRDPSREAGAHIFGKCEFMSPGLSVKDRAALYIVREAEGAGRLKKNGTIVEGTAGNTGIGLAIVAAARGYRSLFVIPDTMSRDKIDFLRAFGAEVRLVPKRPWGDPEHYYAIAERIAREIPGAIFADQFGNPANVKAHYETTGPEIWRQTEGKIDVFMAGMGTSGTLVGAGRYLKEQTAAVRVFAVDPMGPSTMTSSRRGNRRRRAPASSRAWGSAGSPASSTPPPSTTSSGSRIRRRWP